MKYPIRTVGLVTITFILLAGCQFSYPYTLILSVKDANNNQPVPGVSVKLDTSGSEEQKFNMDYTTHRDIPDSEADGQVLYDFKEGGSQLTGWYLKLKKEGYEIEVIDIKPSTEPKNRNERTILKVEARMRPIAK